MAAGESGVGRVINYINAGPFSSTSTSRNVLRLSTGAEVVSTFFNPFTVIPTTVGQSISSIYAMMCKNVHHSERFIHIFLSVISLARFGLAIALLFGSDKCVELDGADNLCLANFVFKLIYAGVLLAAQTISEASKGAYIPFPAGDDIGLPEDDSEDLSL